MNDLIRKQRLIDECEELELKANKLQDFILGEGYMRLDEAEQKRLVLQRNLMDAYAAVLWQRIEAIRE